MGDRILIVGGTRSGKSRLAARLAETHAPVSFVATATREPDDAEMAARIDRHRAERPTGWTTIEAPRDLEGALPKLADGGGSVIVDCLTLWISNLMLGLGGGPELDDPAILGAVGRLGKVARGSATVIWVSNEVGSGVIPENRLARRFADLQGTANQIMAEASDRVYLCVAGLPLTLK